MNHRTEQDGQIWSRRWRSWLRNVGLGHSGPGSARVRRLEVAAGRIVASVQDRSNETCEVEIGFPLWTDEEWQRVIDSLGSQALFAAQLLAGDLPGDLEQVVNSAGVQLLPAKLDELEHRCTCDARNHKLCEHLVAVYYALGEMLPEDPWLLFRLRGRDQQAILRALRTQRSRNAESGNAPAPKPEAHRSGDSAFYRAASTTPVEEEILPLSEQIEGFWGSGKAQQDFRPHIFRPTVELALLRRLGPPPMSAAGSETYAELAALYRRISTAGIDAAYASESGEPPDSGG